MITYSISEDDLRPWLSLGGFPSVDGIDPLKLKQAEGLGQAVLLRATYEGFSCFSLLFAVLQGDDAELYYFLRDGQDISNPKHHHITALTENPKGYAEVLGVERFVLNRARGGGTILRKRFPQWQDSGSPTRVVLEVT